MAGKSIEIRFNVVVSLLLIIFLYVSNLISYVLSFEEYKPIFVSLRYIVTLVFIIFAFTELKNIYQYKKLFIISFILFGLVVVTKNTLYLDISILILFSVSLFIVSRGSLHHYLGIVSTLLILFFGCFVFFTLIGDLDNEVLKQPSTHLFTLKSSLGFVNPNVVSMLICTFTIVLLIYQRYILFLLYFVVFSISSILLGSRTYILALFFSMFIVVFKNKIKKIDFLSVLVLVIPLLISVSLFFNINSSFTLMLDVFLNGRIYGFYEQLEKLSLFNFLFGLGSFDKVDVVYFNLILGFGVVGYMIIVFSIYYLLKKARNDNVLYCLICSLLFICFFENILTINSILTVLVIYQFLLMKSKKLVGCQ